MMFEDSLTYQPGTLLNQTFSALLAADLDDDARKYYLRSACDIAIVASGVDRASQAAGTVQALLEALAAAPSSRAACWRRFYRTISRLVASSDTGPVPDTLRAELVRAIGRLRQFLSENRDLADPPAIGELEYTVLGRTAAGA